MDNIYQYKVQTSKGEELCSAQFQGKTLMIINPASKCGSTTRFDGLEKPNQKCKDRGLATICFTCGQFAHRDPGSDSKIEGFYRQNYSVTSQIMREIDVDGKEAHPF